MLYRALLLTVLATACTAAAAQNVNVTASPISPSDAYFESGTAFDQPLVAFRLAATSGNVDVNAITLTLAGTGSFTTDITGLEAWLDDGDGSFNATLDQSLWSGAGAASSVQMTFGSPLTVTTGTSEDIWIVASFAASAGSSLGKSYQVSIANAADVAVDAGSTVNLGTPPPQSTSVSLIEFAVTSATHNCHTLTISGIGFTPPVQVYIDGVPVAGAVQVDSTHTQVMWEFGNLDPVPTGNNVQLNTASLGLKDTGYGFHGCTPANSGPGGDSSSCSAQESTTSLIVLFGLALSAIGLTRLLTRRKQQTG